MIIIVDYGAGNITSVRRALDHLGVPSRITADPDEVARAERVIFPGVGHAASAMENLRGSGLDEALRHANARGVPILGICLGCQIVLSHSQEGDVDCLNLLPGQVVRLSPGESLKVPHMGWNSVAPRRDHPLFAGITPGTMFYFVHSYYTAPDEAGDVLATSDYGMEFCVMLGRDNLVAAQFHPEKSGPAGLRMLDNFAKWEVNASC
jgi:glutamine amidotransferase